MRLPRVSKDSLAAYGYLAGWKFVQYLPLPVARGLFRLGADAASRYGHGMPQLRRNLARVVGAEHVTPQLVRASVRSYSRYWLEAFRLPSIADDPGLHAQLHESVVGKEYLEASVQAGRGVILVLPHMGNWDMAGMYLAKRYGGFTTVAERLKPEALYEAFVRFREGLGFTVVPLTGADSPYAKLRETLERGGIVALLGERDLRHTGVPVTFFGEQARMPAGGAKLAIETGAALHAVALWNDGHGWGLDVSAPLEVPQGCNLSPKQHADAVAATVQRIAEAMEQGITQHPEDWHALQPLWVGDLDYERYVRGLQEP